MVKFDDFDGRYISFQIKTRKKKLFIALFVHFTDHDEVADLLRDATQMPDKRTDCTALNEAVGKGKINKNIHTQQNKVVGNTINFFHLENIDDVQKLLIDHDINGVNNEGDTPLIIAVKKGSYNLLLMY